MSITSFNTLEMDVSPTNANLYHPPPSLTQTCVLILNWCVQGVYAQHFCSFKLNLCCLKLSFTSASLSVLSNIFFNAPFHVLFQL